MEDGELRPDPDSLLQQANETTAGKLKIFFGASAGVGKTYAMLQEAQRLRKQGLDVLVGIVETHGRSETAELLEGLEILPLQRINYRNRLVQEFDLDAALARHPAVVLVDELAHSNTPGSRHAKRWQDVEELLDAGIDVLTTVNVQHLESLNDIVGSITGVRVYETIPDHVFDEANEVVMVDLPPDDLRRRLHEGKVYLPEQAERAIENFFRKGNLIALRELALRCTANRIDDQIRTSRDINRPNVWHTSDSLLLCVGPHPGNEKLIRTAARLAARFGSIWHAVYVETPRLHTLPDNQRYAILQALKLAQELGAETATLAETSEEKAILNYAREHNLGKVILGRSNASRWRIKKSLAEKLGQLGPELDLLILTPDSDATFPAKTKEAHSVKSVWQREQKGIVSAIALTSLVTLLAEWLLPSFDRANIMMVYLLGVVIIALFFGRWPSVLYTVLSVVSFDLFFVQPIWSFTVSDMQYLVTFAVMLIVGISIANLTSGVRYQASLARQREQRARHMYEISKTLSRALSPQDVAKSSRYFLFNSFQAKTAILLPDPHGQLQEVQTNDHNSLPVDPAIARWCYDNRAPAGAGTDTLAATPYQLQPLGTSTQIFGVLVIEPNDLRQLIVPEQQRLLKTYCTLIGNALERLHLVRVAEETKLDTERRQVRSSLISDLSKDLQIPLTNLLSRIDELAQTLTAEHSPYLEKIRLIRQQNLNAIQLIDNLLEMANLQSGEFQLHKVWQSVKEIINSVLAEPSLSPLSIQVTLQPDLPLLYCDTSLLEKALLILLENAHKYAGVSATIGINSYADLQYMHLEVWDDGPGLTEKQLPHLFDKFFRGNKSSVVTAPGLGLGLATCRAIVEIHNGKIQALHRPGGGLIFHLKLPLNGFAHTAATHSDSIQEKV